MRTDRAWIGLILGWAALQIAWRYAQGPALELDEAEAFYHARELALGYNAQPPLYFWLQWGVFQLVGGNVFALALLKNALLAGGALSLYAMLRRLRPPLEAGLAVAALGLLPQILWEAQRALTHSVLATAVALMLMALTDRILRAPGRASAPDWIALGLLAGLGTISKWNVALLPAALLVAALWRRPRRAALSTGGLLLAALALAAVVIGPLRWVLDNPALASGSVHKLGIETGGALARALEALASLAAAWAAFCGLVILVAVGVRLGTRAAPRWRPDGQARLMIDTMVAGTLLLALGLVATGATEVKDRWLLPVAIFAAPVAALWMLDRLGPVGRRRFALGLAGLWGVAILLLPVSGRVEPGYRDTGFPGLAAWIESHAPEATIVTDATWVAGNLRLALPGREVWTLADMPRDGGPVLWVSRDGQGEDVARSAGRTAEPLGAYLTTRGRRDQVFGLAVSR
ncbi:glycosyltransferase family 39 protein [Limimaricola pyoseonensis]|uniref:4-amino-4-deoxy-L-arabinose transferase n=1 Tax=Limimaricola pyoseonensis TaxID=521013 RepID=A0A1G7A8H7_9RHOB|nr:glycosyltransferase family 39 protein [Limimaricola pyoseonensis]SDE11238.1 4-amino-4-deoxy-L-arabinose transferase [Limimaricola pyoseonensis]